MRKVLYAVVLDDLLSALKQLGYTQLCPPEKKRCTEWRHRQFHLLIRRKGKTRLILSIHEDVPNPYPPFHRAKHSGRRLREELARILEAYKNVRASKTSDT